MSAPRITVVIPTRDRPAMVGRAARSALEQTLPPLEVIVVDDGELGGPLPEDPRVRAIRAHRRRGDRGAARNDAAALARGELIAFLDDDDVWYPDKLARQVEVLDAAAATFCGFEFVDDGGEPLERHTPATSDLRQELLMRPLVQTSGLLVRRDAFREIGGFPEGRHLAEDWVLLLRLAEFGEVVVQSDVLVARTPSVRPPDEQLEAIVQLYDQEIKPRLTPRNQAPVDAHHRLIRGVLLAQMGERRAALRLLWRSTARWQVLRVATGERVWAWLRKLVRGHPGA